MEGLPMSAETNDSVPGQHHEDIEPDPQEYAKASIARNQKEIDALESERQVLLSLPRDRFFAASAEYATKRRPLIIYGHELARIFEIPPADFNLHAAQKIGRVYEKEFNLFTLTNSWVGSEGKDINALCIWKVRARGNLEKLLEFAKLWTLKNDEFLQASAHYVRVHGGLIINAADLARVFEFRSDEDLCRQAYRVEKIYENDFKLLASHYSRKEMTIILAKDASTLVGMLR